MAMNPKRRVTSLALITLSALVLGACADTAPSDTAATVDGVTISDQEVATTAAVYRSIFDIQQQPCGTIDGDTDTAEAACNRFALSQLIGLRLAEAYATGAGIAVTDEEVATELEGLDSNLGADVVATALADNAVTRDDLAALARGFLLQDESARAIALDELGEDGLKAIYEENAGDYMIVQVDHILVATKAEAEDVYAQVTAEGATRDDFLALAKEVSTDPSAKENSGSLGSNYASTYVPEFAQAALALEPGQISEPVQTDFGWHVIHLVDKEVTPFDQVRDDILGSQSAEAFASYVKGKDEAGQIDVNPSFGRFDQATLSVVRISSTDPSASPSATEPVNVVPAG
jgi:parvulin-like peptidyl-prolyl isomerase